MCFLAFSGFDGDVSPFSAKNDYKIGYLTQDPDFDDSKTVLDTVLSSDLKEIQLIREYELLMLNYNEDKQARLERVMAEMDSLQAWEIESQVKTVLSKLGIQDLSTPVGALSGGLRRRVQLAQVLLGNHDLLLLDEPTNHLDIATIEWLTLFLKNSKKTVLFITHDRYFLDALSTRIFELDRAGLTEYQGNYQDYVRLKAEQDERDAALLHKKEQLYKQELAWMRRQPQARATKQQARINRFHDLKKEVSDTSVETDLSIILKLAVSVKRSSSLRMFPLPMMTNRFCKILTFWSKPKTVSESLGIMVLGSQLFSISLQEVSSQRKDKLSSVKRFALLIFLNKSKV